MFVASIIALRSLFFIAEIPIAASVPMMVANIDAAIATISVVLSASIILSSLSSLVYQSNVKPFQTERLFESLKEKAIITIMGAYRNMKMIAI